MMAVGQMRRARYFKRQSYKYLGMLGQARTS